MTLRIDRLLEALRLRGMSQRQLSIRCHIGDKQVYLYMRRGQVPSADILSCMALSLRVSADWLMGHVDEMNGHLPDIDPAIMDVARRLAGLPPQTIELIVLLAEEAVARNNPEHLRIRALANRLAESLAGLPEDVADTLVSLAESKKKLGPPDHQG